MPDLDFLNRVRTLEMEQIVPLLPPGGRILEFGAGTGQQAKFLAERGFNVVAIDLPSSVYARDRVFPVEDYDGRHIPLLDASVDAVFSSNVLEHVQNVPEVLAEFRRVLRPGGIGVHVMPTPAWRFWTFVTAILESFRATALVPLHIAKPPGGGSRSTAIVADARRIVGGFVPRGHGISREGISELWTFSRSAWRRTFERSGFTVVEDRPLGLLYTGTLLLGLNLPFGARRKLAAVAGSSTHIFLTGLSTNLRRKK